MISCALGRKHLARVADRGTVLPHSVGSFDVGTVAVAIRRYVVKVGYEYLPQNDHSPRPANQLRIESSTDPSVSTN
jgi:hypothetical protein